MLKKLIAFAGILCAMMSAARAAETPSTALMVLNKGDTSLVIVDPQTLTVVGRIFCGQDPHETSAVTAWSSSTQPQENRSSKSTSAAEPRGFSCSPMAHEHSSPPATA